MTYQQRSELRRQMRSEICRDEAAYHLNLLQIGQMHTHSLLGEMGEMYHSRRVSMLLRKATQLTDNREDRRKLLHMQVSISEKLSDLYEKQIQGLETSSLPRFIADYLISRSTTRAELYKGRARHSRELLRSK